MTRDDLIDFILFASTPEDVARAQKLRDEWIAAHPDDDEVFEASETLEMMAEGHTLRAAGKI